MGLKFILILSLCFSTLFYAQKLENGVYVGFEQNPACYTNSCCIDYSDIKLKKYGEYFKITIEVSDNNLTLSKLPVIYLNKRNQNIDTISHAYYFYNVNQYKDRISGRLLKTSNKIVYGGIPKFTYTNYMVSRLGKKIFISNENNKNIRLRKIR